MRCQVADYATDDSRARAGCAAPGGSCGPDEKPAFAAQSLCRQPTALVGRYDPAPAGLPPAVAEAPARYRGMSDASVYHARLPLPTSASRDPAWC